MKMSKAIFMPNLMQNGRRKKPNTVNDIAINVKFYEHFKFGGRVDTITSLDLNNSDIYIWNWF